MTTLARPSIKNHRTIVLPLVVLFAQLAACSSSPGGSAGGNSGGKSGGSSAGGTAGSSTGGTGGASSSGGGSGHGGSAGATSTSAASGGATGGASASGGASGGTTGTGTGGSAPGGTTGIDAGTTPTTPATETIDVPGDGNGATTKTSLTVGELYLLRAAGTVTAGGDTIDAEYDVAAGATTAADVVGGVDVGVDVGPVAMRGGTTGRGKWVGIRADHVYYMIVTGAGKPLTMKLAKPAGATATGSIAVSLYTLTPSPPQLASALETLSIPVQQQVVHSTIVPTKTGVYLLQCTGQGKVGGNGLAQGDAEYMDYTATGGGAVDIGDGSTDYGVGVDAIELKVHHVGWWGPWRSDHTYFMLYIGTGSPIAFLFFDVPGGYGDNSATDKLTMKIFAAP